MSYKLFDWPPEQFRARVLGFFTGGGRGLNVTLPHKPAAAELANELTPRAERAGAVNTLALRDGNQILGDNTDGAGLVRDLRENLHIELAGGRLLVIGAGGAARGILGPLLALEPAELLIANRTAERARQLARRFAPLGNVQGCGFDALPRAPFDIVINATAASVHDATPDVPREIVGEASVCYDLAYGKNDTPFVAWARQAGCRQPHKGWGMLVEQAAESFHLWRGVRPDTGPVLAALQFGAPGG
jgi:shikimate dehydrogenase